MRLEEIYQQQSSHLDEKLKKHAHTNPNKFEYLNEPSQRECYIKTRTLVQLDEEIKLEKDKWLRAKEYLVCSMTGNVMEHLRECIGGKGLSEHLSLCSDWLAARKEIEVHWNARLTGKDCDNLEVYRKFFEQAANCWKTLCNRYSSLNSGLLLGQWNVDIFDIKDKFYMDCTYSDTSERYLQFFALVEQYEKEKLPDTAVVMLAKAYFQDEKISNEKELQEAFAALCEANKLRNNNNYGVYFYDFNGLYQTKRQHIMQYLHHDLLNLGDEFTGRCWKNYNDLIQRQLGDNISKRIFNGKVSQSVLHQAFKKMIIVLSELELVAKSPISTSVDVVEDVASSQNKLVEHKHYFSSLYSSYKGCWFKSQERKQQA